MLVDVYPMQESTVVVQGTTVRFLYAIVAYVTLLSLATLSGSEGLKSIANIAAISIFAFMVLEWVFLPRVYLPPLGLGWCLSIYYIGLVGSEVSGFVATDFVDFIKILIVPTFVVFGAIAEAHRTSLLWNGRPIKCAFWILVLFPLLVFAFQIVTGASSLDDSSEMGIFINRNNAALYVITLMSLYMVLSGRPIANPIFFLAVGLGFGTLGVLVAVLFALVVSVGNWRTVGALALCLVLMAGAMQLPGITIMARLEPVIDSFEMLAAGSIDLHTVTYADLVRKLHTSDLSFIFRLKHWLNLWSLYSSGEPYQWLFGLGVGSSVRLSDIGLVPHNDYLRYLIECGPISLLGFVALLARVISVIGRRWEVVPTVVIAFYFFSENLINNFLAMMILFFCAGALAVRSQIQKKTEFASEFALQNGKLIYAGPMDLHEEG